MLFRLETPRSTPARASQPARRALLLAILVGLLPPERAAAAPVPVLGPHWGEILTPSPSPSTAVNYSSYLFSEFGDCQASEVDCRKLGDINRTYGFNIASLSRTKPLAPSLGNGTLVGTNSIGFGFLSDRPTKYFQNVIHDIKDIPHVKRDSIAGRPEHVDGIYLVGTEVRFSPLADTDRPGTTSRFYTAAGLSLSNVFNEFYAQIGIQDANFRLFYLLPLQGAVALRVGSPFFQFGRTAFLEHSTIPDENLTNLYTIFQGSLVFSPGDYETLADFAPFTKDIAIGYTIASTTGAFVKNRTEVANDKIPIPFRFASYSFSYRIFRFETTNDMEGNTDIGPSYSFKLTLEGDFFGFLDRTFHIVSEK